MPQSRFEILDIPGSGASATVCLAKDRQVPDRGPVCLKVLKTEYDSESSEAKRVRDEARLLALLKHPNIVGLYDQLLIQEREVLVMEWVEGPPLSRIVRKTGKLPHRVALEVARQVALATHYAYTLPREDGPLRLVHRDLTLDNILMSVRGEVKILDYGLAKADFSEREAQTKISLRATPAYAAPEGLNTISDNPKLDVYALGISLFFMVTGHLPVLSRNALAHRDGLSEQLAWLKRECKADVVDGIVDLMLHMCSFDPRDRPSMDEVVTRLEALLVEPVDLTGFGEEVVGPLHRARPQRDPVLHEAYEELRFLQSTVTEHDLPEGDNLADERVRAFMKQPDWATRSKELKWMLLKNPDWTARPFLEVLKPACEPWWKVFLRRPTVRETLVSLSALASRRSQPGVLRLAKVLRGSRNADVARMASRIVEGDDISLA